MYAYTLINSRRLSIVGFSFIFAYILSFLFEGQALYSLLDMHGLDVTAYLLTAIIAHFIGLLTSGLLVKSHLQAKKITIAAISLCLIAALAFFFTSSFLWMGGLIVSGYAGGCAVAAWGYYLKAFTPKKERLKTCADILIISNLLMILLNMIAIKKSPLLGLTFSIFCLLFSLIFVWLTPVEPEDEQNTRPQSKTPAKIRGPLILLCLFVLIITLNSGLMYQVINPSFKHLTGLTSWYWALPYIAALVLMRNLPRKAKGSIILYIGMVMIMGAFISFMLLGREASDYVIVDTLMLGACGIFDLFWWSILGEMLDYTENPAQVFGIGLAANVFGVLCGDLLGMSITSIGLADAEVVVIALTIVCLSLAMLPPLNQQLLLLLKSHTYLAGYEQMSPSQQSDIVRQSHTLNPLTEREEEVLQLILSGKSNREIAASLIISENTVKTHVRNIFSKYDISSRAELISSLLRIQIGNKR